jgi:acyl-CoA synthetase (AMP-forming)/AMP-acid ligase II
LARGIKDVIAGRLNLIISGGENIYPSEVEGVLCAHPKVKDVAVIGVPDDKWDEAVKAMVVLHEGQQALEAEMLAFYRDRLAGYKRPRSVLLIADAVMPRTAAGKILHRKLREQLAARPSRV